MKYIVSILVALLLSTASVSADWFQEIEATSAQTVEDKMDFTVRFMPAKTHLCDTVLIECVFHQEFPWQDVRGRKYTKIHEPVSFEYLRRDAKMVHDLDHYISFRSPWGLETLQEKYGKKVFNKDYPVTVSRLRITARSKGQEIWSYTIDVNTKLDQAALARQVVDEEPEGEE